MQEPVPRTEDVLETLKSFVSSHGVVETPIACVQMVVDAGHGQVLRETAHLLFGPKTK
jgi:hypothetical protein